LIDAVPEIKNCCFYFGKRSPEIFKTTIFQGMFLKEADHQSKGRGKG